MKRKILITGANGQVGTKLYESLMEKGNCIVIASDIGGNKFNYPLFEQFDVTTC